MIVTQAKARHTSAMRTIHAVFQSDGGWFIARCLDVPVTTQGKTLAAAQKNLREAVELYLVTWGDKNGKPAKEVYLTSMEVAA
jgi:predicted RNase H-like HicB family nuclease